MTTKEKTHYRKAFNSPYLSSADIVAPIVLTIKHVKLEVDLTNKTKDLFNTAHFVEDHIRVGEKLKPMILNATNSKTVSILTGSAFIDDWLNIPVTVFVDKKIKMMGDTVEGLRISSKKVQAKNTYNNFEFLKSMGEIKKEMEEEEYYRLLGTHGYSHANEVPPSSQKRALMAFNMKLEKIVINREARSNA